MRYRKKRLFFYYSCILYVPPFLTPADGRLQMERVHGDPELHIKGLKIKIRNQNSHNSKCVNKFAMFVKKSLIMTQSRFSQFFVLASSSAF